MRIGNTDVAPRDEDVVARERTAQVGAAISGRLAETSKDLTERLAADIEELRGDRYIEDLLRASIESNLDTVLHVLQHDIDLDRVHAPAAALEYARRLAQRGVPVNALVRAYRLGLDSGLKWLLSELRAQEHDADVLSAAALHIVSVASAYIDRVTERVVNVYTEERETWVRSRNATRATRVRELLAGDRVDVDGLERAVGYRLRRRHLAAVLWTDDTGHDTDPLIDLERAAAALAKRLDCRGEPLVVPCDERSVWAWLPIAASGEPVPTQDVATEVESLPRPIHAAFGSPGHGVAGFCHTHRQAMQAQTVAQASAITAPSATFFGDVGPVALMCADLDATRSWVSDILGPLAIDDEPYARLRETLRVFLASECSYLAAAEELGMHKNSVQYRLRKAEELRGQSLREDRLNLELALNVCHWLRGSVLSPPGDTERARM